MPSTVIFDADCGVCQATRRTVEALDWTGAMHWLPQQDPEAASFGIPRRALEQSVYLVTAAGRQYQGFSAVKQMVLRLPAAYAAAGLAIRWKPVWGCGAIAIFFSPLFHPLGQRAYDWVAANRYLFPGATCAHTLPPMG